MNQDTMKAVVATAYGSPEVLQVKEVSKPQSKEDEILVKVMACSTTTADTILRSGKPYFSRLFVGLTKPKNETPGTGFSGIVEEKGSKVTQFNIGERVFGETLFAFSSNAEYLVVKQDGVVLPMPETMEFVEAATYCDGHLTSLNFLQEIAQIKSGEKVLINGASGSLGTSAIQLAKHFGAHVTAVCSGRNVGLVKSLGANEVIDYTKENFSSRVGQYDVIYDTIGICRFKKCRKALNEGGKFITPVFNFHLVPGLLFHSKQLKFAATGMKKPDELRELLTQLKEIFKSGKLQTVIERQFPLEKVQEAHRIIDTGHKKGNIVIKIAH